MIESFITSFMDGRIRLRHPALKGSEQAEQVRELLSALPGMLRVTANPRAGSLLIEYDPARISREDLLGLAGQWEAWAAEEAREKSAVKAPLRRRCGIDRARALRFANRGMLAALAASLALGAARRPRGHALAGGLFLLFNLMHLYACRKCR